MLNHRHKHDAKGTGYANRILLQLKRQNFDLDWEYTEATSFFSAAFAQWQPVNLPEELYVGNKRNAWNGRVMTVVCSSGQAGEIMLKASADSLNAAEIRLNAK